MICRVKDCKKIEVENSKKTDIHGSKYKSMANPKQILKEKSKMS